MNSVVAAFRVGACAWDMSSRLGVSVDAAGEHPSWTAVVLGLTGEEVEAGLESFAMNKVRCSIPRDEVFECCCGVEAKPAWCGDLALLVQRVADCSKALPSTSTPWISARAGPVQYSISAKPDILEELTAVAPFNGRVVTRLPIRAPYHASHLYSDSDVERLVQGLSEHSPAVHSDSHPISIVSCVAGQPIPQQEFADTLRTAVADCLIATVRWDLVYGACASRLLELAGLAGLAGFSVHPVASCFSDKIKPGIQACLDQLGMPASTPQPSLTPAIEQAEPSSRHDTCSRAKIAIVGCSGRFPRASNMEEFWDVLVQGIDTHELVPASRWDHRTHVQQEPASKNTSGTGFGCWVHDAAAFDVRFFNMSPREAPQVDPAQRMALLCAAEALEQAGIVPDGSSSTQKNRVGVYFGCTSNDWMETNSAQNIDTYFIPGGNRAFIPGRINYHFKFSGPSYTIDTACSSSLTAIQLACNALWRGEVDTAIVGGTNVLTNPDMTAGLDRGHFLSRTGNCKTFDESADGYCRGEAVVTAILKRLDDATRDSDPVQAVILSVATNHSAEADSITRPHVAAQQDLIDSVLADAGVDPTSISYVEMHGTGTQVGDAAETASVLESLAPVNKRLIHQPLHMGAAKANVGHGEAAAGITSLAKVLLMMKHSKIPPHCGIKTRINSKIPDLKIRNTFIAKTPLSWQRPVDGVRRVLLNNFSAAGGNTALVLEDAPQIQQPTERDPRSYHVVAVSAKTASSLQQNLKNMIAWIGRQDLPASSVECLSYTSTARRAHYPHRVAVSGRNLDEIRSSLQDALDQGRGVNRSKRAPRLIFAFTGQGSHFAGMGSVLYTSFRGFKADIDRYDQICVKSGLPAIRSMFTDTAAYHDADPTVLQLTTVCLQMALVRLWRSFGLSPSAVVGHSLGEYPALYAAGVLSQAEVIHFVGQRAQLLQAKCKRDTHMMLAVRCSMSDLTDTLGAPGARYEISCINGRQSIVIGGLKSNLQEAVLMLKERGIVSTPLDVAYAFHTSQVDPIIDPLVQLSRSMKFAEPQIPIICPAYGKVIRKSADFDSDFIAHHCRSTVDIAGAMADAQKEGVIDSEMACLEIGPAVVVSKMVKDALGSKTDIFATIGKKDDDWKLMTHALSQLHSAGATIDWISYHKDFKACHRVLDLPAYSWEMKDYWMQYEHSWSLRKGDPPLRITGPELQSSSIHRVIQSTLDRPDGELIVEADLNRKDLNPMVQGHKVYGVPLCTPSVYADIALTIGDHILHHFTGDDHSQAVEVAEMTIQSALVAKPDHILRTTVKLDKVQNSARCTFSTVDHSGKVLEQHAHCTLRLFDKKVSQKKWTALAPSIQSRMHSLDMQAGENANTFRFSRSMIYKMIGQLADFDPNYRGLVEITLDNDALEARGRVSFKDVLGDGQFHTNPAYIDALSQLGGFVMNANETVDLEKEVFVNHGWGSFQLFEPISPHKTYRSHVKMSEQKDKLWTGDVVIFDEEAKIVAVFLQVALQCVPKRLMEYIVNTANKRGSSGATTVAKPLVSGVSPAMQQKQVTTGVETRTQVTTQSARVGIVDSAMQIISAESGIAVGDLTDESSFDEIGMDSLLCLLVNSKLRDELDVELDSAKFAELGTVGKLKSHLHQFETPVETVVTSEIVRETTTSTLPAIAPTDGVWPQIVEIISQESGLAVSDLTDDACFADIGVDSLLSLLIWSRLRDELGIDTQSSPFLEFENLGNFKKFIVGESGDIPERSESPIEVESDSSSSSSPPRETETPVTELSSEDEKEIPSKVVADHQPQAIKPAWSLVLQGKPKTATETLFLFPDGCGAATSYLWLPRISPTTAVVAFNSPFMKTPQEMVGRALEDIVTSYVTSLQNHQPHGPYHLGGWSAGGILAYAIAQRLMADGEEVATLQLIDSPAPTRGLDRLPDRFFDHCSDVGIFGREMGSDNRANAPPKAPEWLMPHFRATIELLHDYAAPPMPPSRQPKASIIWAGSCAFENGLYAPLPDGTGDDQDTEGMKFLTEKRQDFGPGEWADLFPGQDISVKVMEGEHHFSMMRGEGAEKLSGLIRDFLLSEA
jgi:iterative type I PKS product template protein